MMPGRKRCCCSGVPKAMMTGATITGPNGTMRGAQARAHSSSNKCRWMAFQPGPPNCCGQAQPCQPLAPRILAQRCRSSLFRRSAWRTLCAMSAGRLARTHSRISARKASSASVKLRSMSSRVVMGLPRFLARSFTCRLSGLGQRMRITQKKQKALRRVPFLAWRRDQAASFTWRRRRPSKPTSATPVSARVAGSGVPLVLPPVPHFGSEPVHAEPATANSLK
jgi:hypothetical protein